jgi:hypothetical protein
VPGYARGSTYGGALLRTWEGALTEQEVGQLTENLGPDRPNIRTVNVLTTDANLHPQCISCSTSDQTALPADFSQALTNTLDTHPLAQINMGRVPVSKASQPIRPPQSPGSRGHPTNTRSPAPAAHRGTPPQDSTCRGQNPLADKRKEASPQQPAYVALT